MINFDSFSHGQVLSKIWLCDEFEKHIPVNSPVLILGGWHNVLGFMLLTRRLSHYGPIVNVDHDAAALEIADKLCDTWVASGQVVNILGDAIDPIRYIQSGSVVINCSVEHMDPAWFFNLPKGTLVCIQSSNVTTMEHPWLITHPNPDIETLVSRFPMTDALFTGTHRIQYETWGYDRYMLIGRI